MAAVSVPAARLRGGRGVASASGRIGAHRLTVACRYRCPAIRANLAQISRRPRSGVVGRWVKIGEQDRTSGEPRVLQVSEEGDRDGRGSERGRRVQERGRYARESSWRHWRTSAPIVDWEVLLCDNGSVDGTLAVAEQYLGRGSRAAGGTGGRTPRTGVRPKRRSGAEHSSLAGLRRCRRRGRSGLAAGDDRRAAAARSGCRPLRGPTVEPAVRAALPAARPGHASFSTHRSGSRCRMPVVATSAISRAAFDEVGGFDDQLPLPRGH